MCTIMWKRDRKWEKEKDYDSRATWQHLSLKPTTVMDLTEASIGIS